MQSAYILGSIDFYIFLHTECIRIQSKSLSLGYYPAVFIFNNWLFILTPMTLILNVLSEVEFLHIVKLAADPPNMLGQFDRCLVSNRCHHELPEALGLDGLRGTILWILFLSF